MRTVNRNSTMLGIVALLVGLLAAAPAAAADPATQIRELTGAETRIVWLRNKRPSTALGTHLNGTKISTSLPPFSIGLREALWSALA